MRKSRVYYLMAVIFIVSVAISFFVFNKEITQGDLLIKLAYALTGIAFVSFVYGLSGLFSRKIVKREEDLKKQFEIEKNDERNIAITNMTKAKTFDLMSVLFGALILVFGFMAVDAKTVVIMGTAYILVHIYGLYLRFKFDREI